MKQEGEKMVSRDDEVAFEEKKRLALQEHLQQVKDPAALVLLRRLKARIDTMRKPGADRSAE